MMSCSNVYRVSGLVALLVLIGLRFAAFATDQAQQQSDIPPGMEIITVGPTQILIPIGTKVTRKDALLVLEPPDQYMARKILDMEAQLASVAAQVQRMEQEINALRQQLDASSIKRPGPVTPEAKP